MLFHLFYQEAKGESAINVTEPDIDAKEHHSHSTKTVKGKLSCIYDLSIPSHFICVELEEIVIQDNANTQKQFCINTSTLENIIHIRAVTKEFSSEPTDGSFLSTKLFLNEFSDVNHKNIKGRNHSILISELRYRQAPCNKISTNSSHPTGMNHHSLILRYIIFGGFQSVRIRAKAQISLYV